jgi:hypothetical protein
MPGQDNNPEPSRSTTHQAARLFSQNLNRVSTAPPTRTAAPFPPPHAGMAVLDAPAGNRQDSPVSPTMSNPDPTSADRGLP